MDIDSVTDGRWMGEKLCQTAAQNHALNAVHPALPSSPYGQLLREDQQGGKGAFFFWLGYPVLLLSSFVFLLIKLI